jgi:hypothetical protein
MDAALVDGWLKIGAVQGFLNIDNATRTAASRLFGFLEFPFKSKCFKSSHLLRLKDALGLVLKVEGQALSARNQYLGSIATERCKAPGGTPQPQ